MITLYIDYMNSTV